MTCIREEEEVANPNPEYCEKNERVSPQRDLECSVWGGV